MQFLELEKSQFSAQKFFISYTEENEFSALLKDIDQQSQGYFSSLKNKNTAFTTAKKNIFLEIPNLAANIAVVQLNSGNINSKIAEFAKACREIAREYQLEKIAVDIDFCSDLAAKKQVLRALVDSFYSFNSYRKEAKFDLNQIQIAISTTDSATKTAIKWAKTYAEAAKFCRDLSNTPANICTPTYLAAQEKTLENLPAVTVEILDKAAIAAEKMGGLLAVSQGSEEEPRFIAVEYRPKNAKNSRPIVLVGKGVCFDAGGISLKPAAEMDLMKYDKCGATTVLSAIYAAAQAELPLHIVALIAATENLPSGTAIKPGDIISTKSGKTVEILNTDAEGRLILADAISYSEKYQPQYLIDIATLTGACVIALGSVRAGLFTNNEELGKLLINAGEEIHDRAWNMPTDSEYGEMMKSPFADLANISGKREAGAATAAAFLQEFLPEKTAWAHLDIAGVAWKSAGEEKGSTARPLALIFNFLSNLAD